ncbi:MAG: hypothetical protein ABIK54_03095 [candidate division WOR-3 bacterium]
MGATLLTLLLLLSPREILIRGRDYFGPVKVSSFLLDSNRVLLLDVDGDHKADTLSAEFLQIQWCLRVRAHRSEVLLDLVDAEKLMEYPDGEFYAEVTTAYLTGEEKPVLLVAVEGFPALGNSFWIYDIYNTARGLRAETLLEVRDAGWANSPVFVKPGHIEIRHFRNWIIARYVWDGEKFVDMTPKEE